MPEKCHKTLIADLLRTKSANLRSVYRAGGTAIRRVAPLDECPGAGAPQVRQHENQLHRVLISPFSPGRDILCWRRGFHG